MIFSLLNVRKKTAAAIAGISIGAACLWGLSIWQDISPQEILSILVATVVMLGSIIIAAMIVVAAFKLIVRSFSRISPADTDDKGDSSG